MGGNHSALYNIVKNMSPQEKAGRLFVGFIEEQIKPEKIVNRALKKLDKEKINRGLLWHNQYVKISNDIQKYVNKQLILLGENFNLPLDEQLPQLPLRRESSPLSRQPSSRQPSSRQLHDYFDFGKGRKRKRKSKRMSKRRSRKRR